MKYYHNGQLLFVDMVTPYRFAVLEGDRVISTQQSLSDAEIVAERQRKGRREFIRRLEGALDYLEQYPNENGDIGDLYVVVDATDFEKLIPCAGIETVYQAVWDYLYYGYTGDDDEDIE